jgi:hypothetical protein
LVKERRGRAKKKNILHETKRESQKKSEKIGGNNGVRKRDGKINNCNQDEYTAITFPICF